MDRYFISVHFNLFTLLFTYLFINIYFIYLLLLHYNFIFDRKSLIYIYIYQDYIIFNI